MHVYKSAAGRVIEGIQRVFAGERIGLLTDHIVNLVSKSLTHIGYITSGVPMNSLKALYRTRHREIISAEGRRQRTREVVW